MSVVIYRLFVSENFGEDYVLVLEGPLTMVEEVSKIQEAASRRWYIESSEGAVHSYGKYQKSYIDMVLKESEEKEGLEIATDDAFVTRVLKTYGIGVITTAHLISRIHKIPLEEAQDMLKDYPIPKRISPEDIEGVSVGVKSVQKKMAKDFTDLNSSQVLKEIQDVENKIIEENDNGTT